METKLDVLRRNAKERTERLKNLEALNSLLDEAKEVFAVIPNDHQLQTQQERAAVKKRVDFLSELIADEQNAIDKLAEGGAAENLGKIFTEMGEPQ